MEETENNSELKELVLAIKSAESVSALRLIHSLRSKGGESALVLPPDGTDHSGAGEQGLTRWELTRDSLFALAIEHKLDVVAFELKPAPWIGRTEVQIHNQMQAGSWFGHETYYSLRIEVQPVVPWIFWLLQSGQEERAQELLLSWQEQHEFPEGSLLPRAIEQLSMPAIKVFGSSSDLLFDTDRVEFEEGEYGSESNVTSRGRNLTLRESRESRESVVHLHVRSTGAWAKWDEELQEAVLPNQHSFRGGSGFAPLKGPSIKRVHEAVAAAWEDALVGAQGALRNPPSK